MNRGSLNATKSKQTLLLVINKDCNESTVFCSENCKVYNQLAGHWDAEDTMYFLDNHNKDHVDPS